MHDTYVLRFRDRVVLGVAAIVVSLPAVLIDHGVGLREAAFAQSIREMSQSEQWLIPTIGGLPWITSSPLTQWFAHSIASVFGISNVLIAVRLAGILPAILATQWTASFAAACSGRRSGVLAGFVLLTTLGVAENIWHGGHVIWLVAAGSGFMNLLASLESLTQARRHVASRHAAGGAVAASHLRAASVPRILIVFALLGLTTLIAGPLAALVTILVPAAGHVLWSREFKLRLRNPWLAGWLVTAAVAAAWPAVTTLNVMESSGFWLSTLNPVTPHHQPIVQVWELIQLSLPWLPLAIFGQWCIRHDAFAGSYSRERLLACWSISVPVAAFLMTPSSMVFAVAAAGAWSVSAAIGVERLALRIFSELPMLETRHNRAIMQKFLAASAAVLTLSIVWNDLGTDSRQVDRELLARAGAVAEQQHGQPLRIDMNIGDHAAVLLFELGDRATPLHSIEPTDPGRAALVITSADLPEAATGNRIATPLFENSRNHHPTIFRWQPGADAASTRIAAELDTTRL